MSDALPPVDPGSQPPTPLPAQKSPVLRPPDTSLPKVALKPAGRLALGWFWILPGVVLVIVILVVCLSLFQRGPQIVVHFKEGHGLKTGDAVRHRGITLGEVRSVELGADLKGVDVVIDLRPTAAAITVEDSKFWIVRPRADLTGLTGLETVIGAKYIAVLPGSTTKPRRFDFIGEEEAPAAQALDPSGLRIVLEGKHLGGLRPGVPLLHRQVRIGSVISKPTISDAGAVEVEAYVLPEHVALVREKSVFWNVSGFQLNAGLASGFSVMVESIETVLAGGVAVDTPGELTASRKAKNGDRFRLADGPPRERGGQIAVNFKEGHGLKEGDLLRHRGISLGEVSSVQLSRDMQEVNVVIDLRPAVEGIAVENSRFWIVRPQADLTGISGLDTVVGAKYVAVSPGSGGAKHQFIGDEAPVLDVEPGGLRIVVQDRRMGGLRPGALLTYRGVRIGDVVASGLASDASAVDVHVHVLPAYKELVRSDSEFWNVSGFKVHAGLGLTFSAESAQTMLGGGMAMATPTKPGNTVRDGHRFKLAEKEPSDWQAWHPSIPLINPNLPEGMAAPRLVRATLKYNKPGRLYGTNPAEHRGLLLPVDGTWLLGPEDLLSVPKDASPQHPVALTFEGMSQPIRPSKETGSLRWLKSKGQPIKESLPGDRLRPPLKLEKCLLVTDAASDAPFVSESHLKVTDTGWVINDDAPSAGLPQDTWHGAAAVSVDDGKVIGLLLAPQKGPKRIVPLTKDLLRH